MSDRALEGVKVVDFGWVLVSPLIVKTLADYGATAVCVESIKEPQSLQARHAFQGWQTRGRPGRPFCLLCPQ